MQMSRQLSAKQQGFTIIELVVVILLLGILAATALPRFMDVTDEAHEAAFEGVYGGFTTGVAMYRAQYIGSGQQSRVTLDNNASLDFDTALGYPLIGSGPLPLTGTAETNAGAQCRNIFNTVLQAGRPSIAPAIDNNNPADELVVPAAGLTTQFATAGNTNTDFVVAPSLGAAAVASPETPAIQPACYYVYTGQYSNAADAVAAGETRGLPFFVYTQAGDIRRGYVNATTAVYQN